MTILNFVGELGVAATGVIITAQAQAAFIGFAPGVSPIFSYNFGANNPKRLKQLLKSSVYLNISMGVVI